MSSLPNDILYMICNQLGQDRDFNTLFKCACSGKQLALLAVTNIYRLHDMSPVTAGGSDEEVDLDESYRLQYRAKIRQEKISMTKWAGLWRSIVLSSLGLTLYPYSRYIRMLNLQDLEELLSDPRFRDKMLFQGHVAQFKFSDKNRLSKEKTIRSIGEVITKSAPLLEELAVNYVRREDLSQWITQTPRLKRLNIWNGEALAGNGNLIRDFCPSFKTLSLWDWRVEDSATEDQLGTFLNELRPLSLQSFKTFNSCGMGSESLLALSCHGESLTELMLKSMTKTLVTQLSMLKGCTNLVSLSLAATPDPSFNFEHTYKDVFLETIDWFNKCKKLHTISFSKFPSGSALLTPLLLDGSIQLTKLEMEGYSMDCAKSFHQALANQTSLQTLSLKGETNYEDFDGNLILVESLSKLVNLTDLHLGDISELFQDRHISYLARSLPKLEVWWTGGSTITDAIWSDMSSLQALRRLDLAALTRFTANGILNFIHALGPGNKGLVLAVINADIDCDLEPDEFALIHRAMTKQVDGRFEFTLVRDLEISSFDSDSD